MKKFFKYSLASICIVLIAFGIYIYTSGYRIEVQQKGINSDVFLKGFENAIELETDENGNYVVCYEKEIVKINSDNKTEKIYTNNSLEIEDVLYMKENLLILSKGDLLKFDLSNGHVERILKDIPYGGENIKRKLLEKDGKLLLSIGTYTNTGIAEEGDIFTKSFWDKSPINLTLNGENYGNDKTGAFREYGKESKENEEVKAALLGNGAVYEVDINSKKSVLYSSGIKNITSWDLNSKNEIVCAVEGLEAEGVRRALRDSDYIYKINKGSWYGWPDYSGGDKISSAKFSDSKEIAPLIKYPPEKNVKGPYYEHNKLKSISELAIDKKGILLEKDTIVFFDNLEKKLYSIDNNKVVKEILSFDKNSKIEKIIFLDTKCLLLDSNSGYIYSIQKDKMAFINEIPKSIIVIIITLGLVIMLILVNKALKRKNIK